VNPSARTRGLIGDPVIKGATVSTITEAIGRFANADERSQTGLIRASWKGTVLAESARTIVVEGNHYFPAEDVRLEHLRPSDRHTVCPWKGTASYYDVVVGDERNRSAAWYYPDPCPRALEIRDHIAFWHGVDVRRVTDEPAPQAQAA
jgi:uncharacterized protein (DUF427 family)